MRGINSIAKAQTPAAAKDFSASICPRGSMIAMTAAPCLAPAMSAARGRRTRKTISASFTVAAGVGRDRGACEGVLLIRNAGFKSGAGLDLDLRAEAHKFFNRLGRRRDTALGGIVFGGNGDQHEWLRKSLKL